MSDLTSASYGKDNKCDNGISPIFLILLLTMLGGDNKGGCFGGGFGGDSCGCNNGLDGILPLILILCLCGGSF